MKEKPQVSYFEDGSRIWRHSFELFTATVYVPKNSLPDDVINFGFESPYILIFSDDLLDEDKMKEYADKNELAFFASKYATSIVFINANTPGGFLKAKAGLFEEIIENTKIHQYYEDGMAILNNRFTKQCDGYAIRGALFKSCVMGFGNAADYIANNLLKTVMGAGLWGRADITPTACILEGLSVMPEVQRRDIPIVSINNSQTINDSLKRQAENLKIMDKPSYEEALFYAASFRRWGWDGVLSKEPDFDELKMEKEFGMLKVPVSSDNEGDDMNLPEHNIGYISFYNKGLLKEKKVPLLLAFHGGGDSAMYIAYVSEWYRVANANDFLLVCVENHINSTAREMMTLIDHLCERYPVDRERIYASGFSMGGCKSWDLYQEYPNVFAGLAPMDATFEVGLNVYGKEVKGAINRDVMVPIFYTGGEETPLPELPFQAVKCLDRMKYVLEVNDCKTKNNMSFENQEAWPNKIWGIDGDSSEKYYDSAREAYLTVQYFESNDGNIYTAFGSISGQGHECRYHTCLTAWEFLKKFKRVNGKIESL